MRGLETVVRSGVGRHRVQTVLIALATFMAVTAAVLAGSLLVASTAPFEQSFAQQHGAHLSVLFDGARANNAQIAATAAAAGIAESSGPFPVITQTAKLGPGAKALAGTDLGPMTIAGRTEPRAGVDRVSLIEGRWASRPGEIVLTEGPPLGTTLVFSDLPDHPTVTVVGIARPASRTADAWTVPAEIAALASPGTPPDHQMLYRLTNHTTASDMDAARAAITAAVPEGSVRGSQSWLTTKKAAERDTALFVPFLAAFGLLGLVMAVLCVAGVIAGTVTANTHRIGVLKALGFTQAQIIRAYLGQALIPASIGIGLGAIAGNLLAVPMLHNTSDVYAAAPTRVAPWIDVAVAAAAAAVVTATAWAASWRIGRLPTVTALTVSRAPTPGRSRHTASIAARLPLPRPISLGLAQPFARPARTTMTIATVVFGTAAVALAVGLAISLGQVETARTPDTADVAVGQPPPPGPGLRQGAPPGKPGQDGPDPAKVSGAIAAQPDTTVFYGIAQTSVIVVGVPGSVDVLGFTGDASWAGYQMVEGRWFRDPGEAIAATGLLTAVGANVGDTITLTIDGHPVPVRVVGEVFSTRNDGMQVFTDLRTVLPATPRLRPQEYRVAVADGADLGRYIADLNAALRPFGLEARINPAGHSEVLLALNILTALLTLMLVAVAALGVLNAVVLQTRERVHELGVLKAMGMTPRQAITVVLSSVILIGLTGGAIGVPAGMALHAVMVPAMGANVGVRLPQVVLDVYHPWLIAVLGLGGLVITIVGALLPASWAARIRTATALRTE